jgi:hypothetical protein
MFVVTSSTLPQKPSFVSSGSLATENIGIGTTSFDTAVSPFPTSPKPKLTDKGKNPHAIYSSTAS